DLRVAGDDERLGDEHANAAALAGLRDVHALERGIVANVVRGVAVRYLPLERAVLEVDGGHHTIRRLEDRESVEALHERRAAARTRERRRRSRSTRAAA